MAVPGGFLASSVLCALASRVCWWGQSSARGRGNSGDPGPGQEPWAPSLPGEAGHQLCQRGRHRRGVLQSWASAPPGAGGRSGQAEEANADWARKLRGLAPPVLRAKAGVQAWAGLAPSEAPPLGLQTRLLPVSAQGRPETAAQRREGSEHGWASHLCRWHLRWPEAS